MCSRWRGSTGWEGVSRVRDSKGVGGGCVVDGLGRW